MSGGYQNLACFYDRLMSDFDYNGYLKFVQEHSCGRTALDLACGSGRFSILLAENGYKVVAVDNSDAMLNVAIGNTRSSLGVRYLHSDMTRLDIDKRFDLITIVCDGVNYLKDDALGGFFSKLRSMLNDNGTLIFDISSEYKLRQVLANNLYFEDTPQLTYFWQNYLVDDHVDMELVFFEKHGDGYKRTDEKQRQYIHSDQRIGQVLDECGFDAVAYNGDDFSPSVTDKSKRSLFLCKRK